MILLGEWLQFIKSSEVLALRKAAATDICGAEEQSFRLQRFLKCDEANERAVFPMITNSKYVLVGNASESIIGITFFHLPFWEATPARLRDRFGIYFWPARRTVYR
jgi:hypothetical protein